MYTAPGTGAQGVGEQLEQYLLGKRGVQELIVGDENSKLKKGDTEFIAVQNANSVSDTRNKVLNDPLLAIKKQEQRKFEELMNNPIMLRQMKKEMEKESGVKEERGEGKEHRKSHHRHKPRSERRHRDDDSQKRPRGDSDREKLHREDDYRHEKRRRYDDSRSDIEYWNGERRSDVRDNKNEHQSQSRHRDDYRSKSRHQHDDPRDRKYNNSQRSTPPHSRPEIRQTSPDQSEDSRAAALKAMLDNAEDLESSRIAHLNAMEEKEKMEQEREERERLRNKGLGGQAGFMKDMKHRILEEGRMAVVR